jgi:putative PIN family toxin of toxin-antitoxin system
MRALLDTNVLLSAILFGGLPRRLLISATEGRIHLVTTPVLLDEMEELPFQNFGFSATAARATRTELEGLAEVFEPLEVPRVCRDRDDDEVLAVAAAGGVAFIVTGDDDLLVLERHGEIRIITPSEFRRILDR